MIRKFLDIEKKPLSLGLFLFLVIAATHFYFHQSETEQKRQLIPPPPALKHFHFGYAEPLADGLWIRAIQDFDYCETEIANQRCQGNGWLSKMLETITDLSPHFRMPYATGPLVLSVIVNDIPGASRLFDKAVIAFSQDWPILYRAAYHSLVEEQNPLKAAGLLEKAAKLGAPAWIYGLAARLYTESGKKEVAERMVQGLESQNLPPEILQRIKDKLNQSSP
ncbi:MAG: hypothetical protein BroJett040_23880 [Oligoflexia bacterium]|nr:MAG: hypothetical protein BroJett040_23880 [Oligoflexia bacterium]